MIAWWLAVLGGAAALLVISFTLGRARWRAASAAAVARLDAVREPLPTSCHDARSLAALPPPVANYLRKVLAQNVSAVAAVDLRHSGTFNSSERAERWVPFTSKQRVVTRRPGFVWDARIRSLPGGNVYVRDAFVSGEGWLQAALYGAITVANLRGSVELAQGELMRFLAEAAWYPTVLLPGQGVSWQVLDAGSARATLCDGKTTVSLDFHFNQDNLLERIYSPGRYRSVGREQLKTPWQGVFRCYEERDGMRVPIEAEVAWVIDGEVRPYWRGRIESIEYEFAR